MCGIFAISGDQNMKNAGEIVLAGLKKLEYRGYDSWGIAAASPAGTQIEKQVGKISEINSLPFPQTREAIGHSRWATHGAVCQKNAHPHQVGKVTIVHNGIFENFADFPFPHLKSETDSERIAGILNESFESGKTPEKSLQIAAQKIKGRFAILAIFEGIEGVFGARRGSPLIIGRGQNETFIASDIPAFLQKTSRVNYLDDGEMVKICGKSAIFSDLQTGKPREKRNIIVDWKPEESEKGAFPHFMIKEIFDQKQTIDRAINHSDAEINQLVERLQNADGTYLVSCGTAHKTAAAAEYFFARISGRKINVVLGSEMQHFQKFVHPKTAVVAISQSGETADVLESLEVAKKRGGQILAITNVESSSMARLADVHLPINAGPEKAVASTKVTTAQMAILLLSAFADAGQINVGRQILRETSGNINDLLNPRYRNHIRGVAEKILKKIPHENLFIIGRGALFPMALEAAIKIQEVSYIHAAGFAAGELKHGPIALIEKGTPCLILGSDPQTISSASELKSRGAKLIGISADKNPIFDQWIRVPDCGQAQAIASIIPVQILAYYLGVLRGVDPDMPRNLAKSVTVK